ncbi:MAG: shikimate dehydrogenase [Rhodospirillales bacterium]|nr:shikimate dehydrogenase [Rhodospirillales bacterium]
MTGKESTRLAGVIGWPVAHSRSPLLYGHWLRRYRIDGAYLPLAVAPERLAAAIEGLHALGFRGANVTIPYKEEAMRLCNALTGPASAVGAVNTVTVRKDGVLGDNSDAYGFLENIRQGAGWNPAGKRCLILGAGGAARSIVWGLLNSGAREVVVANRTLARAEALATALGADSCAWERRAARMEGMDLLVNATSLGMPGSAPLDLSLDLLPTAALVTDIVYTPLETDLLQRARRRGNPVVDGIGMLLHQATLGFATWFGQDPAVDADLRAAVLAGR